MNLRISNPLRTAAVLIVIVCALVLVPTALADIETPPAATTAYIQTTGPNANLNIGDYRTNAPPGVDGDAGDGLSHRLGIEIPCVPNAVYDFDLFNPSMDADGSTSVIDEIRGGADNTSYVLLNPAGGTEQSTTYTPDSADDWDTLDTITLPGAPVEGTHCGEYILEAETSDDDDNAWRLRVVGADDGGGGPFATELGPDGLAGTGDEAVIGIREISYQHYAIGCQDFYWFVDDYAPTNFEMFMLNFDLDDNISVQYYDPDGSTYAGTVSGQTVWNDAAPQQETRPVYADMDPINPPGDLAGDSFFNPNPGLWGAEICLGIDNQYSFEVPQEVVFLNEPELPEVVIDKDDGDTFVAVGDTLSYTITLTNNGPGAALALPGTAAEFTDTISSDTTFAGCTVNAPLQGTCDETAPGSGVIEANLTGYDGYPFAILPGAGNAPDNTGTITVEVTVNAVADGTLLVNTASFDFSDIYSNNHIPVTATDIDEVDSTNPPNPPNPPNPSNSSGSSSKSSEPEPTATVVAVPAAAAPIQFPVPELLVGDPALVKFGEPETARVGEPVRWTIMFTNPGVAPLTDFVVEDRVPPMFDVTGASSTRGLVVVDGNHVTLTIASFPPGETVTLTIDSVAVRVGTSPATCNTAESANGVSNAVCPSIFPSELPITGGQPPSPLKWIGLGALAIIAGGWWIGRRAVRRSSGV